MRLDGRSEDSERIRGRPERELVREVRQEISLEDG